MIIHAEIVQGSPEWKSMRAGKITASEIGPFAVADKSLSLTISEIKEKLEVLGIEFKKSASKPVLTDLLPNADAYMTHGKGTIDARSALYAKKISERSGAESMDEYMERVRGYTSETLAMQRGTELEPEARNLYIYLTGFDVKEVGFVEHDNGLCGASPDGITYNDFGIQSIDGGLEVKCHGPDKHMLFMLDPDEFENEHKHQTHWQMAIMECKWIDLFGYCPGLPYIKRRVWRNEYTGRMVKAIDELSEEYQLAIDHYNSIFAEQQKEFKDIRMKDREALEAIEAATTLTDR